MSFETRFDGFNVELIVESYEVQRRDSSAWLEVFEEFVPGLPSTIASSDAFLLVASQTVRRTEEGLYLYRETRLATVPPSD